MSPDFRISASWLLATFLFFTGIARAFYLPGQCSTPTLWLLNTNPHLITRAGYSIKSYRDDENIPLLVNKVYSDNTQLQYAYYDLPFVCPPTGNKQGGSPFGSGHGVSLNLGEVLRGDRITTSDFEINMGQDVECQYLCDRVVGRKDVQWAQELIEEGYVTEWILDNLPGATSFVTVDRSRKYYAAGFKMGYKDFELGSARPQYFLYNHYTIVVRWRKAPGRAGENGGKVVVGFEVFPKSIAGEHRNITGCPLEVSGDQDPLSLYIPSNSTHLSQQYQDSSYVPEEVIDMNDGVTMTIPYTYSVYFREEFDLEWSNRWDLYFSDQKESSFTHWLAIINSLIISGILGAICVVIWARTMQGGVKGRGDGVLEEARLRIRKRGSGDKKRATGGLLEKINESAVEDDFSSDDEALEDVSSWKLLHADVFRPPPHGHLLAPLLGSGMQLVFMLAGLLLLSCVGVLNPSWRGGFGSVGIGLFVFAGGFSGYFSSRVYKAFGGTNWRKNSMLVCSSIFALTNLTLTLPTDCSPGPWPSLQPCLHPQPLCLGSSI
jgi:transmembrane 9 superfamily member 2/4